MTNFEYAVKFTTKEVLLAKNRDKPFLIKVDMFDTVEANGHRFTDFEDFKNSEQFKEFIPFLLRYTNLSPELLNVAKDNPSVDIPISFNLLLYISDVKEKYKQQHGVELETFSFLSPEEVEMNNLISLDKAMSINASKKKQLKGVVDK